MLSLPLSRREVLPVLGGLAVSGLVRPARGDDPSRRIRIGQIGVGHAHATKLEVYRRSPEYEVVGIVEPDAELRARAEKNPAFQGVPWMTQEQLLGLPGLQAVLVETRVQDSLDAAEACVAAGKHIGLDKPAGQHLEHFRRILKSAEGKKLLVQMGYMYRYNPGVLLLRDLLQRGWLGDVFEVHAVMSKVVAPADRARLAWHPGGMMFELGCHLVDLVVGVLGKPAEVAAFPQHVSKLDDGLQDNTLAVFKYPKATATIRATALEVDGGQRRHLTVCGTGGTLHIQPLDDPKVRLTLADPHGAYRQGTQDVNVGRYERYVADAADMARILRGEKASDFPYAHDLTVQESLLRACGLEG
jgi:predicted dehydrogenase